MTKSRVAEVPAEGQRITHEEALAFFAEVFAAPVGDSTEILDGLQNLIWAMGDQAQHQDTPPHVILIWRDQLEILRARVKCLSLRATPKAVA